MKVPVETRDETNFRLNGRRSLFTLQLKMEFVLTRLVPHPWMARLPKMLTSFSPETGEKRQEITSRPDLGGKFN